MDLAVTPGIRKPTRPRTGKVGPKTWPYLRNSGVYQAVGPRLKRAFTDRAAAMTPPARALLLLAAAEDPGDRDLEHRAGAEWQVGPAAWDEVLRSGPIRVSGVRLQFRHPLIRAAVYQGGAVPAAASRPPGAGRRPAGGGRGRTRLAPGRSY